MTRLVRMVAGRFSFMSPIRRKCSGPNAWMKTSMCPPQASPTEKARSSATPKAASLGSPDFKTF